MRTYVDNFSKISDKIPELQREKSYDMFYGELPPEKIKELIENPKDYLVRRGIPSLDEYDVKTEIVNHELMFSPIIIWICLVIIRYPKRRQIEIKMIVHDKKEHEEI